MPGAVRGVLLSVHTLLLFGGLCDQVGTDSELGSLPRGTRTGPLPHLAPSFG